MHFTPAAFGSSRGVPPLGPLRWPLRLAVIGRRRCGRYQGRRKAPHLDDGVAGAAPRMVERAREVQEAGLVLLVVA